MYVCMYEYMNICVRVYDKNNTNVLFLPTQQLYSRVAGILLAVDELSSSSAAMQAVLNVFATDSSLQPLLPYFSRFFYSQVKANSRRLPLLRAVIRSGLLLL